jgi:hypothetical protein
MKLFMDGLLVRHLMADLLWRMLESKSKVVSALLIVEVSISYRYEYNNLCFPRWGSYDGDFAFRKGPCCHKNMSRMMVMRTRVGLMGEC